MDMTVSDLEMEVMEYHETEFMWGIFKVYSLTLKKIMCRSAWPTCVPVYHVYTVLTEARRSC